MTTQISTSNIQTSTLAVLDGPSVTNIQVTNSSYTVLDDTAVSLTGGYIKITGTNFFSGCSVVIGAVSATAVTFVNSTTLNVQVPALVAGTYVVYVINPDGGVAIRVNGLTYSSEPTWVTGSSLTGDSGTAVSIQLSATGASTYALQAGSTLPANLTLTSGGLISGTVTVSDETLYNFTVVATDAELQDSPRSFSITITVGDPQIAYVTTLLSPTLTTLPFNDDASTNNFAVTVVGDTRPNNFGPYTPGYYSNYFDGTGDFLSVPSNSAFTLGTSDHTIEFWMYLAGGQSAYATQWKYSSGSTQQATNDYYFQASSAGGATFNLLLGASGSWAVNISNSASYTASLNNWTHVAITRSGNTFRLFANGVQVGSATYAGSIGAQSAAMVIGQDGSSNFMTGYISNFRVVVGQALYTSNFTPPTAPLTAVAGTSLLTCQSNRFIDNSTNNFAITRNGDTRIDGFDPFVPAAEFSSRGSTYFDGTGDYLLTTNSLSGAGNFTIECWVYPRAGASGTAICGTPNWELYLSGFTVNFVYQNVVNHNSSLSLMQDSWNHVVVERYGYSAGTTGGFKIFVNGIMYDTGGSTTGGGTALPIESGFLIGGSNYVSTPRMFWVGYISNLRVVNSTAVYTAAFTPPTAPLTAVTNTSLLTCQTNQPVNNNVFLDSSTNNSLITRNGNTTQGTFSPYGGTWSNYFDGTGDFLDIPAGNSALSLGTGDFTIEFWLNASSLLTRSLIDCRNPDTANAGFDIAILSPNKIRFSTSGVAYIDSATVIAANTWYHIALTRSSNIFKLYINGTVDANTYTGSATQNFTNTNYRIGSGQSGAFTGYLSNVRIVKGTAVYTANFTPSTTPLQAIANTSLLTCADNRLIDDSPNNFAITKNGDTSVQKFSPFAGTTLPTPYYSAYFDGTGDYLSVPDSNNWALGTSDFTIECWVNGTAGASYIFNQVSASSTERINLRIVSPGICNFRVRSNSIYEIDFSTAANTVLANVWTHIAVVRSGTSFTVYINGVSAATATSAFSIPNISNTLNISDSASFYTGYISNFRWVLGTAVYTANFTPSTTPLTAISGTSLLTCQSSTFIDNSTNNFTITAVGDAKPTTVAPFTVTYSTKQSYTPSVFGGSMYFDGTGDFLTTPGNIAFNLSSGSWTVECWFYQTSSKQVQLISSGAARWRLEINTSQQVAWLFNTSSVQTSNNTAPLNQWNHVAVSYNGTTCVMYLNGVAQTATGALVPGSDNTSVLYIGRNVDAAGAWDFNGYISDARIVKGTALYTSNFVLPIQPLQSVVGTTLLLNGTGAGIYDSSTQNDLETAGDAKLSTAVVKYSNTSMAFDGTGDYLIASSPVVNQSIAFGTGNFTVEFWFNALTASGTQQLFDTRPNGVSTTSQYVALTYLSGSLNYYTAGANPAISGGAVTSGAWHHVALSRSGTSTRLFVSGTQVGATYTDSQTYLGAVNRPIIASDAFTPGNAPFAGYISDLRITKGIARYTANFTPPTGPFKTK